MGAATTPPPSAPPSSLGLGSWMARLQAPSPPLAADALLELVGPTAPQGSEVHKAPRPERPVFGHMSFGVAAGRTYVVELGFQPGRGRFDSTLGSAIGAPRGTMLSQEGVRHKFP